MKYMVLAGQSLADIALRVYGNADGAIILEWTGSDGCAGIGADAGVCTGKGDEQRDSAVLCSTRRETSDSTCWKGVR